MATKAIARFRMRGLLGIALVAFGISLAFVFKKSSDWPAHVKTIALAAAYCTGIGGVPLVESYVKQLEFSEMKASLKAVGLLLGIMLLLNL